MSEITPIDIRLNVKTQVDYYDVLHPRTLAQYISYDNSRSGLNATNVRDAINELYELPLDWQLTETDLSRLVFNGVCFARDKFVAIAYSEVGEPTDRFIYSYDGETWVKSTLPIKAYWQDICYGSIVGSSNCVAVGATSKAVYSSSGTSWRSSAGDLPLVDDSVQNWTSICVGGGIWVAVAKYSQKAAYSRTLSTWTAMGLPDALGWEKVCYGDGRFIVIADDSNIAATSTNGTNWNRVTLPFIPQKKGICYGDGKFVIIGNNKVAYSTNGTDWNVINVANFGGGAICYGNNKFVTLRECSTDLINWTKIRTKLFDPLSICYGNKTSHKKFVAVGVTEAAYADG